MNEVRKKLVILAFIIANLAMADNVITKTHNFPINGDRFNKTRVSYITPGDTGRNVVWDFTQAQVVDGNSRVAYSVVDDSLYNVTELNTRYDYQLSGDTLLWRGYENRNIFMRDSLGAVEVVYPMQYGAKVSKPFCFKGEFSRTMAVRISGMSTVEYDAEGVIILPDGDTLTNVARIHRVCNSVVNMMRKEDDSTRVMNATDTTMRRLEERYSWYAKGYRYPIVETIINTDFLHGKEVGKQGVTFLCYPTEQSFKTNDIANLTQRQQQKGLYTKSTASLTSDDSYNHDLAINEKASDNDDDIAIAYLNNILSISLPPQLMGNGNIEYMLSDVLGRVFASGKTNLPTIEISDLPHGDYILSVRCNNKHITRKIPLK